MYTVSKDAKSTCWYEWCAVLRYALKYLKELPNITRVGGIALSSVATALWQLAGTDENLDCAILGLNAGWLGYKEIYKYSKDMYGNIYILYKDGIDLKEYIKNNNILENKNNDKRTKTNKFSEKSKICSFFY